MQENQTTGTTEKKPQIITADRLCIEAENNFRRSHESAAEALWLQALELNPDCGEAHHGIGRVALGELADLILSKGIISAKPANKAIAHFSRALECGLHKEAVYICLSRAYELTRSYIMAVDVLERGIEIYPESAHMHVRLGKNLNGMANFIRAHRILRKALELEPAYLEAWEQMAYTKLKLDDVGGAMDAADKALALGSEDAWVYMTKGRAYQRRQKWFQSIQCFKAAKSMQPDLQAASDEWRLSRERLIALN